MSATPYELVAIAGSGTIATGLAALASRSSPEVILLVRSREAAERALAGVEAASRRLEGADPRRVSATVEVEDLGAAEVVVEAVIEDPGVKSELLRLVSAAAPDADLATTTSSLSVSDLGRDSENAARLYGLHVFNPVPAMELVELVFPSQVAQPVAERARRWCRALDKTAVEVPDTAGFAVNRLLFPYLFDAVRYQERSGLEPDEIDRCMTLGVAHPMGPLALLDLVGLDVAVAIGEALHAESGNPDHLAPRSVLERAAAGHLGRKSGRGFYEY